MDSLPQELIVEIINHLPQRDNISFRYCSLVARSWRCISQKRLFEFVKPRPKKLRQLLDGISQNDGVLLRQVRSLTCSREKLWAIGPTYDTFCGHFNSLRRLENFTLCETCLMSSHRGVKRFSAFKHTLSKITLKGCSVSKSMLVNLINYFPKLEYLDLMQISCVRLLKKTPPIFRLPLKRLYIGEGDTNMLELLDELWKLGLCTDEVVFPPFLPERSSRAFGNRVVDTFGTSAKCLSLPTNPEGHEHFTLSPCRRLRELELNIPASPPYHEGLHIISSMRSEYIKKIVFSRLGASNAVVDGAFWMTLDDILIELVKRPECKLRLEVEFRGYWHAGEQRFDKQIRLPKFVEKGRMTVWDCWNSRKIYCSDDKI